MKRHYYSKSRTYESWAKMMKRCHNPRAHNFKYYGGLGIKVYRPWHDFRNFIKDMGDRPCGLFLDRIDPDRDYEPDNCRWSKNLAFNRRNTNWFTVDGKRVPLAHAARMLGLKSNNSIYQKLNNGWTKNDIVRHYQHRR